MLSRGHSSSTLNDSFPQALMTSLGRLQPPGVQYLGVRGMALAFARRWGARVGQELPFDAPRKQPVERLLRFETCRSVMFSKAKAMHSKVTITHRWH